MCLSRCGGAQHQRLQARVEHERRDGVDELGLEQLDRRHLGEQEPPRVAVAEVDLLQILVEPPLGEEMALVGVPPPAGAVPGRAPRPTTALVTRRAPASSRPGASVAQHVVAPDTLVVAEQPLHVGGERAVPTRAPRSEHVTVEVRWAANGLAGVVDDVVEPIVRRRAGGGRTPRHSACGGDRGRRSRGGHSSREVLLLRVPSRRVAREAGRHDEMGAGAQQLDPSLVPDLHPAARQERHPAPRGRRSPNASRS